MVLYYIFLGHRFLNIYIDGGKAKLNDILIKFSFQLNYVKKSHKYIFWLNNVTRS